MKRTEKGKPQRPLRVIWDHRPYPQKKHLVKHAFAMLLEEEFKRLGAASIPRRGKRPKTTDKSNGQGG